MERRSLLKWGGVAGAVAGAGWFTRSMLLPLWPSAQLDSPKVLATRLVESFDAETRARACVDYDHPLRQFHNRGLGAGGIDVDWSLLDAAQRSLVTDLLYSGLSRTGRERVPRQFLIRWPGVHVMRLLVCGDPRTDLWQVLLTGPHLNLRIGGKNREGVAFGGPQVVGDQRGNGSPGLPRNVYGDQLARATELFGRLSPVQREQATLSGSPIEERVEVQGAQGVFGGVRVAGLDPRSRQQVADLLDGALDVYPASDADYARSCIEHNGGVDAMSLAYFADSEVDGSGVLQELPRRGSRERVLLQGLHARARVPERGV